MKIKKNYRTLKLVLMITTGAVFFDVHCCAQFNDVAIELDLENDDNGNDPNQAIPNLGGQMPHSTTAFDSFEQEDIMNFVFNGKQNDLDVSVPAVFENIRQDSLLMLAVLDNETSQILSLLDSQKNNLNYRNKDGQTALHYAALHDRGHLIELLLKNNAMVDIADNMGRTALHIASQNDSLRAAVILLNYGADATLQDNDDKIPADYAKSSDMKDLLCCHD